MKTKIDSIRLTISDVMTADGKKLAAVMGTVYLDEGKYKMDLNGPVLDSDGEKIKEFETINFTTAVSNVPGLKQILQQMTIEALTLKNFEIAEENGELSHFVQSIGGDPDAIKPTRKKKNPDASTKAKKKNPLKRIIRPRKSSK